MFKKAFALSLLSLLILSQLSACSLLRRSYDEDEEIVETEEAESPPAQLAGSGSGSVQAPALQEEIARLQSKVSALETKIDVLSVALEKSELKRSQPMIEAEPISAPQASMAAPVEEPQSPEASAQAAMGSMKVNYKPPVKAATASAVATTSAPQEVLETASNNSPAEQEFRSGMELFQNGRNLEASARFVAVAKTYPRHLLAAHALYWAGEAHARGQQWSMAIENWEELERSYPRSSYVPEAMAGLARAYEAQGNVAKAQQYRSTLLQAFPQAPVSLNLAAQKGAMPAEEAPVADDGNEEE